jgi:hypothetical protein
MRVWLASMTVLTAVLTAAAPAGAARLILPEDKPAYSDAYASPQIAQPWISQQPNPQLVERPVGEVIAARLGLVNGSAELFRYHLENAPSQKTMLDGVLDGGGIKLKLTW